jgi:hypothetical protein
VFILNIPFGLFEFVGVFAFIGDNGRIKENG